VEDEDKDRKYLFLFLWCLIQTPEDLRDSQVKERTLIPEKGVKVRGDGIDRRMDGGQCPGTGPPPSLSVSSTWMVLVISFLLSS
jgi:hypothetical protein